jgi:hypothetical protein
MTTEISAAGYTDLNIGSTIDTNWNYLELQTSSGTKIIRLKINGTSPDSRVTRSALDAKHAVYTVLVSGSDSDLVSAGLPQTFGKAVFKKTDSDGATVMATDAFSDALISTSEDSLNLTINIGVI